MSTANGISRKADDGRFREDNMGSQVASMSEERKNTRGIQISKGMSAEDVSIPLGMRYMGVKEFLGWRNFTPVSDV